MKIQQQKQLYVENATWTHTIAVLEEYCDGEGADFVLHTCCKGWIHRADNAQRLHDQVQDLGAELSGQVDQPIENAGKERLQHVGALRDLQLVTVARQEIWDTKIRIEYIKVIYIFNTILYVRGYFTPFILFAQIPFSRAFPHQSSP